QGLGHKTSLSQKDCSTLFSNHCWLGGGIRNRIGSRNSDDTAPFVSAKKGANGLTPTAKCLFPSIADSRIMLREKRRGKYARSDCSDSRRSGLLFLGLCGARGARLGTGWHQGFAQ